VFGVTLQTTHPLFQPKPDTQIKLQDSQLAPAVVLAIIVKLAPFSLQHRPSRHPCDGLPRMMDDPGFRGQMNFVAELADALSQICILAIEEKSFIESPYMQVQALIDQQTGSAYPVHISTHPALFSPVSPTVPFFGKKFEENLGMEMEIPSPG
jgi:hypothetical protein